jgi:hypothetical protein
MPIDSRARSFARLLAAVLLVASPAIVADVVQGVVTPAGAEAVIRDRDGNEVARLPAGSYQIRLPAGSFVAECLAPNAGKTLNVRSLAQPTTVNIDCS